MGESIEKEVEDEVTEEITEEVVDEVETQEIETEETEQTAEETEAKAEETEEIVVTIGDEEAPEHEKMPDWVREMRDSNRKLNKRNKELERAAESQPSAVVVGKKPEMSDADIDYDADKFESAYAGWIERKGQADSAAKSVESEQKKQADAWQATLDSYGESQKALDVPDYQDAEDATKDSLNEVQQGVLIHGADNPALVVYALGKNPAKAKELAGITDTVKFAFAVAKLEAQLKIGKRKPAAAPEKKVTGTASTGSVDSKLEKLETEAERTGDRTKIQAYKRRQRANG